VEREPEMMVYMRLSASVSGYAALFKSSAVNSNLPTCPKYDPNLTHSNSSEEGASNCLNPASPRWANMRLPGRERT